MKRHRHPPGVKVILAGMTKEQRLRALLRVCREIAKGKVPLRRAGKG